LPWWEIKLPFVGELIGRLKFDSQTQVEIL